MRRVGLLGGMSWESTAAYYAAINRAVRQLKGGLNSCECIVYSVNFAIVEAMQAQGRWEDAAMLLSEAARALERAGAEAILLCTNTMHKVFAEVAASIRIPMIHIAAPTAEAAIRDGVKSLILLGTRYTMEEDFYRDILLKQGLNVITPCAEDREIVHRVIYEELCVGVISANSKAQFVRIIEQLTMEHGADGVVLGCTEITLLIGTGDVSIPVYDTTALHAAAAAKFACS